MEPPCLSVISTLQCTALQTLRMVHGVSHASVGVGLCRSACWILPPFPVMTGACSICLFIPQSSAQSKSKMPQVVQEVILALMEEVPGGSAISVLVDWLLDKINRPKELVDKHETLRRCLPEMLANLKKLTGHEELVEEMIAQVKSFNLLVQGYKQPDKPCYCIFGNRATTAKASLEEFEDKLDKFTTEMQ